MASSSFKSGVENHATKKKFVPKKSEYLGYNNREAKQQ